MSQTIKDDCVVNSKDKSDKHVDFVYHNDKKITVVDYSNIKNEQIFINRIRKTTKYLAENESDMLLVVNVSGSYGTSKIIYEMKKGGELIKPITKKSVVVGITKTQLVFLKAVNMFSNLEMKPYYDCDEAKKYLIE